MAEELHLLMGDKLHVFKRDNSRYWQCATWLSGKFRRSTTKEFDLPYAKRFAEEWYLTLQLKHRSGELKGSRTFEDAAKTFLAEYAALTDGERSPKYIQNMRDRLRVHIIPFMGNRSCVDIAPQTVQDFRVHRMTSRIDPKTGQARRPARSTVHQDVIAIRHVLKTAERQGWIKFVPNLSPPYKSSGKISHRAWFSAEEYKTLRDATRKRAEHPQHNRFKWESEQLYDLVLFMVNTGLRPDEALRIEFRDVAVVKDRASDETILEISVRGKRGTGYCKSMPGAVLPFERLQSRKRSAEKQGDPDRVPLPTDCLFPTLYRELFNTVLGELNMKTDREGLRRSAYSLRHTYICLRLMEGADIYQVAKNCRTSVEMIEKFYASHIKHMIDASAVNVRRSPSNDGKTERTGTPKSAKSRNGGGFAKRRR